VYCASGGGLKQPSATAAAQRPMALQWAPRTRPFYAGAPRLAAGCQETVELPIPIEVLSP
jgi:hypothetical protein